MSKARKLYNLVHVEPKGYIYVIGNHRYGLEFRLKNKKKKNKESVAVIQMNGSSTNWDDINTQGHWKADSTKKKLKEMLLYKKSKIFCVGGLNESGNPKHGRVWNYEPELNKFNTNNL